MKPAPVPNPVYLIKPKYIFKTPFLKYDLQNPTNREAQNEELTEYFNYGFNEDTMNIYVKLVNRMLKVLDHKKNLQYFDEPSQLMRLNDEIPMDLGGFGKFYDPELFKNDFIQNDQQLFKIFLFNIVSASWFNNGGKQLPPYPMLEFVKSMYPPKQPNTNSEIKQEPQEPNLLTEMVAQITRNLQKKYGETMKKLIEQKNQPKQINPSLPPFKKNPKYEKKPYHQIKSEEKPKKQEKQEKKDQNKKKDKRQRSSSSSSDSSSSGTSSDSSSSSSDSQDDRRKKRKDRDRKDKDSRKESKKEKRSKSKSKSKGRKQKEPRKDAKKDSRKESRRDSRQDSHKDSRHDRRDSKHEEKHRDKKRSEPKRSRSRDHKNRHR